MSTNYRIDVHQRIRIREKDRAARKALRQVCAWCGVVIREGVEPVSHGACDRCAAAWRMDAGLPDDAA